MSAHTDKHTIQAERLRIATTARLMRAVRANGIRVSRQHQQVLSRMVRP